jgi:hypothetical protein
MHSGDAGGVNEREARLGSRRHADQRQCWTGVEDKIRRGPPSLGPLGICAGLPARMRPVRRLASRGIGGRGEGPRGRFFGFLVGGCECRRGIHNVWSIMSHAASRPPVDRRQRMFIQSRKEYSHLPALGMGYYPNRARSGPVPFRSGRTPQGWIGGGPAPQQGAA